MNIGQLLKEFFANLTWPLRGRRVMAEKDRQIWDELKTIRWEELARLREDVYELRQALDYEVQVTQRAQRELWEALNALQQRVHDMQIDGLRTEGYLKGEVAALSRQLDVSLLASEKLIRGNLSFTHDAIARFRRDADGASSE